MFADVAVIVAVAVEAAFLTKSSAIQYVWHLLLNSMPVLLSMFEFKYFPGLAGEGDHGGRVLEVRLQPERPRS